MKYKFTTSFLANLVFLAFLLLASSTATVLHHCLFPWLLLQGWQTVFASTVWTLVYRELKALPALTPQVVDETPLPPVS